MEKKTGLILGGVFLLSLVLVVGVVMAATSATTATVTVNTFLSVTLSNTPVAFPNMNPEAVNQKPTPDPLTATIGPESNTNAKVETRAGNVDFVSGGDTFPISNLEWATTIGAFPGTDYTTSDAQVCPSVTPNTACTIYHELDIPSAQAAGNYVVGITITATATP